MNKLIERFKTMKMENKLLILALVCGLLAALTGYAFITLKEAGLMKSMEPVRVLVAAKYINPKTQINEDMVREAEMPAKFVTSANVKDYKKLTLAGNIISTKDLHRFYINMQFIYQKINS